MRYKDIKQYSKTYNINKIKNVLNKANCIFVCLTDKDMKKLDNHHTICKYVMFNDKLYHSTFIMEYKKLGYDNIIKVLNS